MRAPYPDGAGAVGSQWGQRDFPPLRHIDKEQALR
jgi:hypothetical protein